LAEEGSAYTGTLALSGFMGAGKSTVGVRVAKLLGATFVDLDSEIEWAFAMPVEQVFASHGEAAFRAMESRLLRQALSVRGRVVALGGGAVLDPANRELLESRCTWVNLDVSLATACTRLLDSPGGRPMWGAASEVEALFAERLSVYACAPHRVLAEGEAGKVAAAIELLVSAVPCPSAQTSPQVVGLQRLQVPIPGSEYEVVVGRNSLSDLSAALSSIGSGPIALLSDWNVAPLHADRVASALSSCGRELLQVTLPAGEDRKQMGPVLEAVDQLLEYGWRRDGLIVALGGGVLGDMAGLVASLCLRGVPFVQLPTTVLAMVDSCVGGKVGVNHRSGKNLLGAFHQPSLVWSDLDFLETLDDRQWRAGLAEVVKSALLGDEELLKLLESQSDALLARDPELVAEMIWRCCRFKAQVVAADEQEKGARRILNFGHTVAHALEAAGGFGHLLHGEAVAIGMVAAAELGASLGHSPPLLADRLRSLLTSLGLPFAAPPMVLSAVRRAMERDKKLVEKGIAWVLLENVCQPRQFVLPLAELDETLQVLVSAGVLVGRGE
jgi:shikimate kinase / 3-dehydroquinate synthase